MVLVVIKIIHSKMLIIIIMIIIMGFSVSTLFLKMIVTVNNLVLIRIPLFHINYQIKIIYSHNIDNHKIKLINKTVKIIIQH